MTTAYIVLSIVFVFYVLLWAKGRIEESNKKQYRKWAKENNAGIKKKFGNDECGR